MEFSQGRHTNKRINENNHSSCCLPAQTSVRVIVVFVVIVVVLEWMDTKYNIDNTDTITTTIRRTTKQTGGKIIIFIVPMSTYTFGIRVFFDDKVQQNIKHTQALK